MNDALQTAYVRAMRMETSDVLTLDLEPTDARHWVDAQAGAHIDVEVPQLGLRQYSLMPSPVAGTWRIGVQRDAKSRGGSQWIHRTLRPGQLLRVSAPRNLFALDRSDNPVCLVAGGIGITPILALAHALSTTSRDWQLHYCVRSQNHLGFMSELSAWGERVQLHVGDRAAERVDLASLVGASTPGTHFYCCGPAGMLGAFAQATAALDPACVHREYFAAPEPVGQRAAGSIVVELARSGQSFVVNPDETILDVLLANGVDISYSCKSGVCGSCETPVLGGEADHRDVVLSPAERAEGKTMMPCCSRAKSERLVLDI